ncbi:hypothetical protein D9611_009414 [Ephemerocybe angulata]|uniref:Uncharacterized protein n=1 Tax=Ephemerocybe angulata TaxID=980116 RepID=A0A8H5ETD8_9AGAR|nr:hypothetical protein D9611_009414 [Tulosesus angulatus]
MTHILRPSSQSESTDKMQIPFMDYRPYQQPRTRTWSLYSSTSGHSSRSSLSFTGVPPVAAAPTQVERIHSVMGSFVPSTSAKHSLKKLAPSTSSPLQYEQHEKPRPRPFSAVYDRPTPSNSRPIRAPLSPLDLPTITRTPSPSPSSSLSSSPGTDSSASSIILGRKNVSSELHPVLARLERGSKLCASKTACATCQKSGRDFPQCAKCKKMWCSRECRLVGGKRHVC